MTLVLRETPPDDPQVLALLDALDAYLATLYAPEDNHILGLEALKAPEVRFLVAWDGDVAVGCGAVRRMPAEPGEGRAYGEIKRMYVLPERRGQRIAEQLLAELEAGLGRAGIGLARLETGDVQHAALALYQRLGYRPCAAFAGYPDNGLSVFLEKSWPTA